MTIPELRESLRFSVMMIALVSPLFAHGDLHERIEQASAKITVSPNDASLRLERAELYRRHKSFAEAEADLRRARELDPTLDGAFLVEARILRDRDRFDEALSEVDRFLERHPRNGPALELRTRTLVALQRDVEAERSVAAALEFLTEPRPDLFVLRANLLLKCRERGPERALGVLEEGLLRCPGAASLEFAAFELEVRLDQINEAFVRLDRIAARTQRAEGCYERGATIFEANRQWEPAKRALLRALAAIDQLPPRVRVQSQTRECRMRLAASLTRIQRLGVDQ